MLLVRFLITCLKCGSLYDVIESIFKQQKVKYVTSVLFILCTLEMANHVPLRSVSVIHVGAMKI